MTQLFTEIATKIAKEQALGAIDASLIPLQTAMGCINIILNRREMRESLSVDEVIDLGLVIRKLEAIDNMLNVTKEMIVGYNVQ